MDRARPSKSSSRQDNDPHPRRRGRDLRPVYVGPHRRARVHRADRATRSLPVRPPGSRARVEPGSYEVVLGSGYSRDIVIPVEVTEGETTVVPVTWGALRVEVVDSRNIPHRAGYELIRVEDRDLFGIGYGADTLIGERIQTWIVPPDLYRIVQPGASYRATRELRDGLRAGRGSRPLPPRHQPRHGRVRGRRRGHAGGNRHRTRGDQSRDPQPDRRRQRQPQHRRQPRGRRPDDSWHRGAARSTAASPTTTSRTTSSR